MLVQLRSDGLTIEQFRILAALARDGAQTMGTLAAAALPERPTLTEIVDRMVAAGLVIRLPDKVDRRRVNVIMSPDGERLWAGLAPLGETLERFLAERLRGQGTEALRRLLAEVMRRDGAAAPAAPRAAPAQSAKGPQPGQP